MLVLCLTLPMPKGRGFLVRRYIHRGFDRKRAYIPIAKARDFTPVLINGILLHRFAMLVELYILR